MLININVEYVCAFVVTIFFLSSLISVGEAKASKGGPLALPVYVRLGWKWFRVINALAYNTSVLITAVKSFIVRAARFLR